MDNEVNGNGNQQDYGMRIYNPQIGRFLSADPLTKKYPFITPYAFAENDVVRCIDLDGLEKYEIVFRSFIPQKFVPVEMDPTQLVRNIHYHGGDNRLSYQFNPRFNYASGSQSYRTSQNNDIDFSTRATTFTYQQGNSSKGYDIGHRLVAESKTEENIGSINTTFSTDATTGITSSNTNIDLSATNKIAKSWNPLTPSINARLNLKITPNKDGSFNYSVDNLKHDGFPAYELWVKDIDNNKEYLIFHYNPIENDNTVFSLYGDGEFKYDQINGSSKNLESKPTFNFSEQNNIPEEEKDRKTTTSTSSENGG